jgi:hypothetical protein
MPVLCAPTVPRPAGSKMLYEAFRRGWPAVSSSVPTRVKREAQRYLECGDVRCDFVEVTHRVPAPQARTIAISGAFTETKTSSAPSWPRRTFVARSARVYGEV